MFNSTTSLVAVVSVLGVVMWSVVLVALVRAAWTRQSRPAGTSSARQFASTGQGGPR